MKPVLVTRQFPNMWKAIGMVALKLAGVLTILVGLPFIHMIWVTRAIPHFEFIFDWYSSIFLVVIVGWVWIWLTGIEIITIKAYADRLDVCHIYFTWNPPPVIDVPVSGIYEITAIPEIKVDKRTNKHEVMGDSTGKWKEYFVLTAPASDETSALAIDTNQGKWLVGCPDAVEVSRKLRELYGLPKQPKELKT